MTIQPLLRTLYYRCWKTWRQRVIHDKRIIDIRKRGRAEVVFLATNLPMWRYDGVLRLMLTDNRFVCTVVVHPVSNYSEDETRRNNEVLHSYFQEFGVHCILASTPEGMQSALATMKRADIIFYPQPYGDLYGNQLDNRYYRKQLLCYVPYGVCTFSTQWAFNTALHNQAWRIYCESEFHRGESRRLAFNKGANVVVVGTPLADAFLHPSDKMVWKPQECKKKRIIWAPHFSISAEGLHRNGFLWMAELMLELAKSYADSIQFAFKPHPRLLSMLYEHPEWGVQRANDYYERWASMPNTQYESGAYAELFAQSDAMIHDCGSFTVEYLFSRNPVMFVSSDVTSAIGAVNDFGRQAFQQHYIGSNADDIKHFLDDVVLFGQDPKREGREAFFNTYLLPPGGVSVGQNIYQDIVSSIFA